MDFTLQLFSIYFFASVYCDLLFVFFYCLSICCRYCCNTINITTLRIECLKVKSRKILVLIFFSAYCVFSLWLWFNSQNILFSTNFTFIYFSCLYSCVFAVCYLFTYFFRTHSQYNVGCVINTLEYLFSFIRRIQFNSFKKDFPSNIF